MSNHHGPEIFIPDDQRCEALVRGGNHHTFDWARKDHRCTKKACATRQGFAVCWVHNKVKKVEQWKGGPDAFPRWPTSHAYRRSNS